jgi:hypothetical protein
VAARTLSALSGEGGSLVVRHRGQFMVADAG